jgi:hypothetical protein
MPVGVYERKKKPAEERFWKYVNKDTGTSCWEWTGCLEIAGYGKLRVNGKNIKAHRFSYQLHKGEIPDGMFILHSCDNPKCIRPDHLSIGTHAENMRDMINKNRDNKAKGSAAGQAKLTENQVIEIKQKLNLGIKQKIIAQEYNIDDSNISRIKTGKNWAHI